MLLSIIIPVYNRQLTLDKLLLEITKSIERYESKDDIEVVVIDDCSNPSINIPVVSYPINLHVNSQNRGSPISRQLGLQYSKGDFVHFHDSDDNVSENWLEEIIKHLQDNLETDILLTARNDIDIDKRRYKFQKFFHNKVDKIYRIKKRLIYRNCIGPIGGVTFSRRILDKIEFKPFASCQDWQMYIEAIEHVKVLGSRPDIKFIFNKMGDDRISHNPRKKILGHLQLAKLTGIKTPFGRNIRLFYLYTCKQHVFNKGGTIFQLYKKKKLSIFFIFLIVSLYWRIS